mmetsp:Transcript_6800/g.17080  ORF Transcript_6800/g.17080 Transcript_6800/m.17080 type:complete len:216 (+) Transcript_6800:1422-2069(+)
MRLVGAHTDLGAEAVPEAIRKACGRIPVRPGRVHLLHELLRDALRCGHDCVGVARSVRVDVVDCVSQRVHHSHRHGEVQKLSLEVLLGRGHNIGQAGIRGKCFHGDRITLQLNLFGLEGGSYGRQHTGGSGSVDEQGFRGIASSWVVGFGVNSNRNCSFKVSVFMNIHTAESISMAKHWNAGASLYVLYKSIGTTGNHQVNILIQLKQRSNFCMC